MDKEVFVLDPGILEDVSEFLINEELNDERMN